MRSFVVLFMLLISTNALAATAVRDVQMTNPQRSVGYVVGDVFKRTLEIEVAEPYTLSRASLPAEGVAYAGLELRKIKVKEKRLPETTRYRIEMTYQVFAHSRTASKLRLPTHFVQVTAHGRAQKVPIPGWNFRISPLAIVGETDFEKDMSPYRAPLRVETRHYQMVVGGFFTLVLVAVLGLIYINADSSWFPGMGGPFAASYRQLIVLPDSPDNLNKAVASIQTALNTTFGENLFHHDLERFFARHPQFKKLKNDMDVFFNFSYGVLFGVAEGPSTSTPPSATSINRPPLTLATLTTFCRACRDCERGIA